MSRVEFVTHRGKRILFINFAGVDPDHAAEALAEAKAVIAREPLNSLLTLTDISNTKFPKQVTEMMKAYTAHNKPYVRAAAVVGCDGLRKALVYVVSAFTGRDLAPFDDLEKAKDWLAGL